MKKGAAQRPPLLLLKIVMKNGASPFACVDINDFLDFAVVNIKYPAV
jgi:hypothetical protein